MSLPCCRFCHSLGNRRYKVVDFQGELIGEGNAAEAVELVVSHLPLNCGAAVKGISKDLEAAVLDKRITAFMSKGNIESVLGLEHGVVLLRDHTHLWAERYREEEELILHAAGSLIIELQHIGSTAVPAIKAKPVLDMLAGVERLEQALGCISPLAAIGYDYLSDAGIANDYVFGKGLPRTHYLHLVEYEGAKWNDHLRFRDRLRNEPALARAYEKLKEELSRTFSDDRAKYHDAKSRFIEEVVAANE